MVVNWCLLFNVNSLDSNNMWPVAFLTVAYFVDLYYLIVLGYDRMSYPYKFDPRFFIKTIAMVLIKKWGSTMHSTPAKTLLCKHKFGQLSTCSGRL